MDSIRPKLEELERKGIFTFDIPTGEIHPVDAEKICNLLFELVGPFYTSHLMYNEDWSWEWLVTKGEYAGTLPKRISNFCFKRYGVHLSSEVVSQIGNIARNGASEQKTIDIEFTTDLDWSAGEYGDGGSCFWGDRTGARMALIDHRAYAMRFYKNGRGWGRCWLVPDEPKSGCLTIFNCYPDNWKLCSVARILSTLLGLSYQPINLENYGDDSDEFYINNGSGYIVGPKEEIDEYSDYDFRWDVNPTRTCYECDECYDQDDMYEVNDRWYCRDCYNDNFTSCDRCDAEDVRNEDTVTVYVMRNGSYREETWCDWCAERHSAYCDECGERVSDDSISYVDGYDLCADCIEICAKCETEVRVGDLEDGLCSECYEEKQREEAESEDQFEAAEVSLPC